MEVQPVYRLLISLAFGLLVGLQRQWIEAPLGGVRTFALISVFGTLCVFIADAFGDWVVVGGLLGVIALIMVGNFSPKKTFETEEHSILSTEVAMLVMFMVGALTGWAPLGLAVVAAGILAVVLQFKTELHRLIEKFTEKEIRAFMQFVLISMIILPILPDRTLGPLDVLNPREIWLMVILIVGVGLVGYILYKFFGDRAGTWLGGILGGVISSTATTASYAKKCKEVPQKVSRSAVVITLAWTVMYIRMIVLIAVAAPLFKSAYLPLSILTGVSFLATLALRLWGGGGPRGMLPQENPSELKTALLFGFLFAIILLASAAAKQYFGDRGLWVTAFISGLTDLDAITLSTARLVRSGKLLMTEGSSVILVAVLANLVFKTGIVAFLCGRKLLMLMLVPFLSSVMMIFALLLFGEKIF